MLYVKGEGGILEQFSLWLPPGKVEGRLTWKSLFSNVINMEEKIKALRDALKKADQVAVLTGAGISAESGVPTLRGDEDLRKAGEIVPKLVEAWG